MLNAERELQWLWRREMICGAYVPRWVELKDMDGNPLGFAITFTIDTSAPQYAGNLDQMIVVHRLATASGGLGSSSDYLFRTCEGLRSNGLRDVELEHLASLVQIPAPSRDDLARRRPCQQWSIPMPAYCGPRTQWRQSAHSPGRARLRSGARFSRPGKFE
ncbi:gamma-glutamylcyclotransferase [Burkholderia cepacia]|uniref:gamma-glutamylcyclotransferase n=1 Tax=Burkholderia cepacia TaxID=292 RepID=UPI00249E3C21|nr:gamma-glutamylcyclotransferase [Burkholderia cepacia]WGY70646.1 gamma-glutamylcyclotransferase [Burkholderia cepacia]